MENTMTKERLPQETPSAAQYAQQEAELARREAEVLRRELHARALEKLGELKMPAELAQLLDYTDEARFEAGFEALRHAFAKAVQKGVEERMAGDAPKAGDHEKRGTRSLADAIAGYYNMR